MPREITSPGINSGKLWLLDVPIPAPDFGAFLSVWLIQDTERDRVVLVETGPAVSIPSLASVLSRLGVFHIDYIICTHVHLDHTGGLGHFLKEHPETKVVCPEKGRVHLVSPGRLWEGSLSVLGDIARIYREPISVPESAFVSTGFLPEGLESFVSPGHASHHDAYLYDLDSCRILFVGEAAGSCIDFPGVPPYQRPATPPRFRYEKARHSLERLLSLNADILCFPHYGVFSRADEILSSALSQLDYWWKWSGEYHQKGLSVEEALLFFLERDPCLKNIGCLPGGELSRERYFIRQSLTGMWSALDEESSQVVCQYIN